MLGRGLAAREQQRAGPGPLRGGLAAIGRVLTRRLRIGTAVSLARSVASLKWRTPAVGIFFVVLSLAFGIMPGSGWLSWLPIAASCIGTTALFFLHGLRMRVLMLLGTLLWLVNNLLVGSIGGSLLEACLALANLHTIRGLWRAEGGWRRGA